MCESGYEPKIKALYIVFVAQYCCGKLIQFLGGLIRNLAQPGALHMEVRPYIILVVLHHQLTCVIQ